MDLRTNNLLPIIELLSSYLKMYIKFDEIVKSMINKYKSQINIS